LVTFFAAAKKVTAAPHRGEPIDREENKSTRSAQTSNGVNSKPKAQKKNPKTAK
jgi:hypothetical protein